VALLIGATLDTPGGMIAALREIRERAESVVEEVRTGLACHP
jgi:hypothetical protein